MGAESVGDHSPHPSNEVCLVAIPTDVIPVQEDAGIPPLSANGEGV